MPEAALLFAEYIFDRAVEKFGLETQYRTECLDKIARRIFLASLA
jgi:hypothetical protein